MKDLQGTFIFAVCLLAFAVIVLFFKYGQQRVQSQFLEAENLATQNMVLNVEKEAARIAKEAELRSRVALQSAQANLAKAKEAREMLEKSKSQSAISQKEMLANLNAQLEREADARIAAEKASVELAEQRDILKKTVEQTKKALEELKLKKSTTGNVEISRMQKLLQEREAEILKLKKRQAELEALCKQAETAQRATEMEIKEKGGVVTIPRQKRISSPNFKPGF